MYSHQLVLTVHADKRSFPSGQFDTDGSTLKHTTVKSMDTSP